MIFNLGVAKKLLIRKIIKFSTKKQILLLVFEKVVPVRSEK